MLYWSSLKRIEKMMWKALGYDTTKFVKFVQTPDEIGQPGVWSEGVH